MDETVVYLLFPGDDGRSHPKHRTVIWGTEQVLEMIEWYQKRKEQHPGFFVKKLLRYSEDGFAMWEGNDRPIRHEWDHVYRIGHDSTLFRVVGFYGEGERAEFIACEAFLKSGQALNRAERARIDRVADIRKKGLWRKELGNNNGH